MVSFNIMGQMTEMSLRRKLRIWD